jgi:hypothetical protein
MTMPFWTLSPFSSWDACGCSMILAGKVSGLKAMKPVQMVQMVSTIVRAGCPVIRGEWFPIQKPVKGR